MNVSIQFTKPRTLTTFLTLSKSPKLCLSVAHIFKAHILAASYPCSTLVSLPTLPIIKGPIIKIKIMIIVNYIQHRDS